MFLERYLRGRGYRPFGYPDSNNLESEMKPLLAIALLLFSAPAWADDAPKHKAVWQLTKKQLYQGIYTCGDGTANCPPPADSYVEHYYSTKGLCNAEVKKRKKQATDCKAGGGKMDDKVWFECVPMEID